MKHSELLVWQKAMDLVSSTYRLTASFPDSEKFGLIGQLQRAAVSMPANIAEGHGRKSTKAYLHHLSIANGSLMEFETLIRIAARLGYLRPKEESEVLAQTEEIGKMLNGLRRSVNPES